MVVVVWNLLRALTNRNNPLTARVIVNRIWSIHFGQPLVGTPSNFGKLGGRPSHPRLLDDLAVRFMENGWSLKWLQREIVLSSTYRQTSQSTKAGNRIDVANRLLWHMNRRRLDVEAWRDTILMASNNLNLNVGGKSIDPMALEARRRTVYSRISRFQLDSMLSLFDFPDPNAHSARRSFTTTPLQKLFVLNSPFMSYHAEALAKRVRETATGSNPEDHVINLYGVLFGRTPTDDELSLAIKFVETGDETSPSPWQQLCHTLLASNELLYVD